MVILRVNKSPHTVYFYHMNLQSYVVDLVTLLNNIIIPFMMGVAFLVFVINVFRFFIVGGTNPDSQEKAKTLAVYGVGAFVFIIIFWGIINLLTSSFGLERLSQSVSRCSDYECPDGNNPSGNTFSGDVGGGFGSGIGDPRGADIGDSPSPNSPNVNTPGISDSPNMPTPPNGIDSPDLGDAPNIPNSGFADYTPVTAPAAATVQATIPTLPESLLTNQFDTIGEEGVTDAVRVNTARAFTDAEIITEAEFRAVLNEINTVRELGNFPSISANSVVADPVYSQNLRTYKDSVQDTAEVLDQYYDEIALELSMEDLYRPSNYNLEDAMESAYNQYNSLTGTVQGNSDREDVLNNFVAATNVHIELTGDNNGVPITREDILGG